MKFLNQWNALFYLCNLAFELNAVSYFNIIQIYEYDRHKTESNFIYIIPIFYYIEVNGKS